MDNLEFAIKIDFNKSSKNPSHVFRVMTEIIDSFSIIDAAIINSIHLKIQPLMLLEDIQNGSLISRFKYFLENIPDDAIANLEWKKVIGKFLIDAKYIVIDFINNRETITNSKELESLEKNIKDLSNNFQMSELSIPGNVNRQQLLQGITKISDAISKIEDNEELSYFAPNENDENTKIQTISFNLAFNFTNDKIDDLLTAETIKSHNEMILKIKKPDYLGDSKWEFRHRKETIYAKINDNEWLTKFRDRQISLKPGDSIRANVEIEVKYDFDREVNTINHTITNIIEVIYSSPNNQSRLFH